MINADVLTFQEFMTHETLTLATIQTAVLEFLQGRDDVVLFGSQAVNAYVKEPRMTQDVDILSNRAEQVAEELRDLLDNKFHIAVRVRKIGDKELRVYQTRKEGNRHLVDIRIIEQLPNAKTIENIKVLSPSELIASKVISYNARKGQPKAGTDWRDLAVLLLQFPDMKVENGEVYSILIRRKSNEEILSFWREIVSQDLRIGSEDEDLFF